MKPREKTRKPDEKRPAPPEREERGGESEPETLDFARLDLTVEKVEERISPSETNVFDK